MGEGGLDIVFDYLKVKARRDEREGGLLARRNEEFLTEGKGAEERGIPHGTERRRNDRGTETY